MSKDNLTSFKEIKDKIWLNRKFSMYTLRNVIMNIREKTSESFIKNHTNKGYLRYHIILLKDLTMKLFILLILLLSSLFSQNIPTKKLVYIVSDISIPFWEIMSKGIKEEASKVGYSIEVYSSNNSNKTEIENLVKAINNKVDGIVLSPINSSSAVFLLKLAKDANIPVVISDIGTDGGEYLSYISSDNEEGSYRLGKILTSKMKELEIENGTVGIISIPQERANGKARTKGFLKALDESNIKSTGIEQQVNFSYKETFDFSKKLIMNNPDMKALWLQGSDKYQGALDAIAELGKSDEILLICFDSEPEFLQMIPEGKLVGAAMQQPFLMGEKAVEQFYNHFNNIKIEKNIKLEILAVSKENIDTKLKTIKQNVLGIK